MTLPQQFTGLTRLSRSVPQLCLQGPEPQWLLCFPDPLSQGKIPFGLSQEKTQAAFSGVALEFSGLISVLKMKNVLWGTQTL